MIRVVSHVTAALLFILIFIPAPTWASDLKSPARNRGWVENESVAEANGPESRERLRRARDMMHASTLESFQMQLLATRQLRSQRVQCEAQLATDAVPVTCFRVLKREMGLGLVHVVGEIRDLSWLERLCVRRASASRALRELVVQERVEDLPPACRAAIQTRVADLRYQYETREPQLLFREHYHVPESAHDD